MRFISSRLSEKSDKYFVVNIIAFKALFYLIPLFAFP